LYEGNAVEIQYTKIDTLPDIPYGLQVELRSAKNRASVLLLKENSTFQENLKGKFIWTVPEKSALPVGSLNDKEEYEG
jgi:hypothetical protein